jgi:hypothetical protein
VLHGGLNLLGHQLRLGLGVRGKRARTNSCPSASPRLRSTRACRSSSAEASRDAAQRLREEVEVGLLERMREIRRGSGQQMKAQIAAQRGDGSVVSSASTAFMNSGCETFSLATSGAPCTLK